MKPKNKNKNKNLTFKQIILILLITISSIHIILSLIYYNYVEDKNDYSININQIEDYHYEYILRAMIDLKPEYINKINQITFSGNQSWIADKCLSDKKIGTGSVQQGCHFTNINHIYVWVEENEETFRRVLCHEILHEIIYIDYISDAEEDLTSLIDESGICFKERYIDFNVSIENYKINKNSIIEIKESTISTFTNRLIFIR